MATCAQPLIIARVEALALGERVDVVRPLTLMRRASPPIVRSIMQHGPAPAARQLPENLRMMLVFAADHASCISSNSTNAMEFKRATCPSCGGRLQLPTDRSSVR